MNSGLLASLRMKNVRQRRHCSTNFRGTTLARLSVHGSAGARPRITQLLATQIGNFTGVGTTAWNGIPASCHIATLYWVFMDEFSRPPAQADFLNHFVNPNAIITRMLSMGHRLTRPNGGVPLALTPGSVIVFERGGQPVHSCV
ncbi:MAG: hypothetical protein ACREQN_03050, partial [Candidatus Binataceae bacterium]